MCPSHAYDVLLDITLAKMNNGFIYFLEVQGNTNGGEHGQGSLTSRHEYLCGRCIIYEVEDAVKCVLTPPPGRTGVVLMCVSSCCGRLQLSLCPDNCITVLLRQRLAACECVLTMIRTT